MLLESYARDEQLTPLGLKVYQDIIPKAVAFERRILDELGPQAKPFLAALERLEEIFRESS